MKASYITLATAGVILVFAACHSWAGGAEHATASPVNVERDTVAFVEGPEAEPPALPADLPMPKSASKPATEVKHSAATPPKESALKAEKPEARPPLHHVSKPALTSEKPKAMPGATVRWDD